MIILIIILILIILLLVNKSNSKNTEYFDTSNDMTRSAFDTAVSAYNDFASRISELETKTAKITATPDGINVDKSITLNDACVVAAADTFKDSLFIMKKNDYRHYQMVDTIQNNPNRVVINIANGSPPNIDYIMNTTPTQAEQIDQIVQRQIQQAHQ